MEVLLNKIMNDFNSSTDDIRELGFLLVEKYHLEDYVKEIKFDKIKQLGMYDPHTQTITINIDDLLESSYKTILYHNDMCFDCSHFYALSTINVLLHELFHAVQTRAADSSTNDTLHLVIKEGIELAKRSPNNLTFREKLFFDLFYHRILLERNAEINAIYQMLTMRSKGTFQPAELKYLVQRLNYLLNRGYYGNNNPCKTYYRLRRKMNEYNALDFDDVDYNLITRLSWGFPVEKEIVQDNNKARLVLK